jgi:hypothetical protein
VSGYDYLPELARDLDRLFPVEESLVGDWADVVRRVRLRRSRRLGRRVGRWVLVSPVRIAVAVVVGLLLLAGIAAAAYELANGWGGGAVSIIDVGGAGNGVDSVLGIGPDGGVRTVWRCPGDRFCGDVVSVAWAPDGRRLALSLTEFGGMSTYVGLHIIDTTTGRDLQIPPVGGLATSAQRKAALKAMAATHMRAFGCFEPREMAWSPDERKLAYVCDVLGARATRDRIYVIDADGSHRMALRTGTWSADWPSWSPDGKWIVFSTDVSTADRIGLTIKPPAVLRSDVYVIALDGSGRRLLARRGLAPVWSPDGRTIAYQGGWCRRIRLVTPEGKDVTPGARRGSCFGISPAGYPVWSPNGTRLAIATKHGVYLVNRNGSDPTLISRQSGGGIFGDIRPAWQPLPHKRQSKGAST